jgi:hypothetical protein
MEGLGVKPLVLKVKSNILRASVYISVHSDVGSFSFAVFNTLGSLETLSHNRN